MRRHTANVLAVLIILCLLGIAIMGCSQPAEPTETPVPTKQQVQIPDVQKPAGQDVDDPTSTPVPPQDTPASADTPATAYPAPDATSAPQDAYPAPIDAKALLETRCTVCHGVERTTSLKKDRAGWEQTVNRMITKGAELTPEEAQALIDYLAENYG